jgi:hypothetical protein
MDVVQIQVEVIPLPVGNMNASQPRPHRGVRKRFLVALVLARVEHCAPPTAQVVSRDLEEVGPLLRIGHVVAIAAAECRSEIELRGDH